MDQRVLNHRDIVSSEVTCVEYWRGGRGKGEGGTGDGPFTVMYMEVHIQVYLCVHTR